MYCGFFVVTMKGESKTLRPRGHRGQWSWTSEPEHTPNYQQAHLVPLLPPSLPSASLPTAAPPLSLFLKNENMPDVYRDEPLAMCSSS